MIGVVRKNVEKLFIFRVCQTIVTARPNEIVHDTDETRHKTYFGNKTALTVDHITLTTVVLNAMLVNIYTDART